MPGRGTASAKASIGGVPGHSRNMKPRVVGVERARGGWREMRTGGKKGPHHRDPEGP